MSVSNGSVDLFFTRTRYITSALYMTITAPQYPQMVTAYGSVVTWFTWWVVIYHIYQTSIVILFEDNFILWYIVWTFNIYILIAIFRPIPRKRRDIIIFNPQSLLKIWLGIFHIQHQFIVSLFAYHGIFRYTFITLNIKIYCYLLCK